jgi:hypothetical protein
MASLSVCWREGFGVMDGWIGDGFSSCLACLFGTDQENVTGERGAACFVLLV